MPPNFFTKLVKNAQGSQTQTTNGRSSNDERVTSPPTPTLGRPHSQTISHPPSPHLSLYGDPASSNSTGSVRIGVIPPSPRPTDPDFVVHVAVHRPSIEQVHQGLQHRRVRSQERHIPDRHEVSLAARPTSDITHFVDEPELTPTPGRPSQVPDWVSFRSVSPSTSLRQLTPASSTGNLKAFVDKQGTRSNTLQTTGKFIKEKPSKRSMRGATQPPPPPPLNFDHSLADARNALDIQHRAGSLEDPLVSPPNTVVVESPTSLASQKAQSQELFGALSDGDTKSVRSATSSTSKHKDKGRRPSGPRKTTSPPVGAPMSYTALVPPLPPLPAPVSGSKSTLSVNSAKPDSTSARTRQVAPMQSPTQTRSPNTSLTRSDFSDGDGYGSSGDESGSSSDELDLNEQDIPVTGFAVASNKRNADFHELFPSIPEGDYLIEDYGCALQREILIQGRLYISENHICFHANIFGWITDLSIPIYEITGLEKKMTAFVIPNAIQITTRQAKYTFASFLSRDTTYDVIANIWRLARPDETLELAESRNASNRDMASLATSFSDGSTKECSVAGTASKETHCACSTDGGHLSELALETVLPGTPDKIYNLMFASGFIKDFMRVDQKLVDVQISDWTPIGQTSKLLQRNMSYIKPLNNSVGPRQTKCEIHDEAVHCDFEDYVVMMTSTKTPDVPSGGVFVVKTRTCLMWASSITTRVIVTTQVEWTGRSFIKGLIEKSAIEGQKVYHSDLDKAMRMYIQEHQTEFVPEGLDPAAVAPVEPITPLAEGVGGPELLVSSQEARKARERDRNRRGMQWAYDTLDGAYHVAERSTRGALELIKEAWEQSSSTTILWFVIVLLVLSNVWTLALVGNREEVGRRKEMKRAEEKERWLQGVIAGVWEELAAERARASGGVSVPLASVPMGDAQAEVTNMCKVLDALEQRMVVHSFFAWPFISVYLLALAPDLDEIAITSLSTRLMEKDTAHKGWYDTLVDALQKEDLPVLQLATTDVHNGTAHVRTHVHRAFITARALPTLPLLLTTTDVRAPKITQLASAANGIVEIVYWTPSTQAQYRIRGRASAIPGPEPSLAPMGVVFDALKEEGFDWEATRRATFDQLSKHLRATFCRPVPGTPLKGGEDEMRAWPRTLPRLDEAKDEKEKQNLETAWANFALLVVEPFEVDHLTLGDEHELDRRTVYRRNWEDERNVAFEETSVVP